MRSALPSLLLLVGTGALFLGGLGRLPLFGRDEALYGEAGREMLATGDWITPRVNGGPFFEKPPLYYWLAASSYRVLGVSPFAARLPAALMAILTVMLTAGIGARVWGRRAGLLAGLALATSLQMALIGRMGIMDVPLTCLTLLALLAYERWRHRGAIPFAAAFGLCVALAILLKSLAGIIALSIAIIYELIEIARGRGPGPRYRFSLRGVAAGMVAATILLAVAAPWFVAMGHRHGGAFGSTFFLHEHLRRMLEPMQGHGGPFWLYLPMIAVSFFPWVTFLPAAMVRREAETETAVFWRGLCLVWIIYVLAVFSLIRTKLPGYVTPLFPAMALLVGAELDRRLARPGRAAWVAVSLLAVLFGGLVSQLPVVALRLGERVGASEEVALLSRPLLVWAVGYLIIAIGAVGGLRGRVGAGLGLMATGQAVILGAVLVGMLPVLSPYLGGGSALLARRAQRELPGSRIVLYETRPETVAFALQRLVPTFDRHQRQQLIAQLGAGPTALIAPRRERSFWQALPARRTWFLGDRVLLEIPNELRPTK